MTTYDNYHPRKTGTALDDWPQTEVLSLCPVCYCPFGHARGCGFPGSFWEASWNFQAARRELADKVVRHLVKELLAQ